MKESIYIDGDKKDYKASSYLKQPIVIILSVVTIVILLLNLIYTISFY